ncbi:MAG: nuclear transport factor 2 family protein [Polyangiaceae bacterium]
MNTSQNIQTVTTLYEAFGRGDVPAVLAALDEDVSWEFGASEHGIPWLAAGTGKAAALGFFQALQALEFKDFRLLSVMGQGEWVVALVTLECTIKANGRSFREVCEPQVWRFNDAGRVIGMRHAADTWRHARALGLS